MREGIFYDNIDFTYSNGVQALRNLSLFIKKGECIAIMGRNGAGKSTLMRLTNGLLHPTKGNIYVDNIKTPDYDSSELTRKVGVMFQNPEHQLFLNSVDEELEFSLKNLKIDTEVKKSYKRDVIKSLELEEFLEKSPYELSGGQRKKVALATILVRKPDYVLFDEPTIGADAIQRKMIEDIIENLKKDGKTIIIITHDIELAYRNTKRLLILNKGEIIADGDIRLLVKNKSIIDQYGLIQPSLEILKEEMISGLNEILETGRIVNDEGEKTKIKEYISQINEIDSYESLEGLYFK